MKKPSAKRCEGGAAKRVLLPAVLELQGEARVVGGHEIGHGASSVEGRGFKGALAFLGFWGAIDFPVGVAALASAIH